MKMLFSSSSFPEVALVRNKLVKAGIPCEVLHDAMSPSMLEMGLYPELWVQQDEDFLAASMLFASWRRDLRSAVPLPIAAQKWPEASRV